MKLHGVQPLGERGFFTLRILRNVRERKMCIRDSGECLGYSEILLTENTHLCTQMITMLFEKGEIEILIGTKSLLGEGWDSPCINALIMACLLYTS